MPVWKTTDKASLLFQSLFPEVQVEPWQEDILRNVINWMLSEEEENTSSKFICAVGAHGIGKTTMLAWLILLCISFFHHCDVRYKGSLFSGKFDQLMTTLVPEIKYWGKKSTERDNFDLKQKSFRMLANKDESAISAKAWSKEEEGNIKGQHAPVSIVIFDEATAVATEAITVMKGATTDSKTLFFIA